MPTGSAGLAGCDNKSALKTATYVFIDISTGNAGATRSARIGQQSTGDYTADLTRGVRKLQLSQDEALEVIRLWNCHQHRMIASLHPLFHHGNVGVRVDCGGREHVGKVCLADVIRTAARDQETARREQLQGAQVDSVVAERIEQPPARVLRRGDAVFALVEKESRLLAAVRIDQIADGAFADLDL